MIETIDRDWDGRIVRYVVERNGRRATATMQPTDSAELIYWRCENARRAV